MPNSSHVLLFSLLDLTEEQRTFLIKLLVIFLCLPVHEMAHAYTAWKLGDPTGKEAGRLTLNPLKHLDLFGALMIIFVGFGYAKPVPVNIRRFKNPKTGFAITAVAGPLSNLAMAFLSLAIFRIVFIFADSMSFDIYLVAETILTTVSFINICLAVFNLIPIPPLDGSRVVMAFLPDNAYAKLIQNENYFFLALFAALAIFSWAGYSPVSYVADKIFDVMWSLLCF